MQRRPAITDDAARRVRAMAMYRMTLDGVSQADAGKVFRISQRTVSRELAAMTEAQRSAVRAERGRALRADAARREMERCA